MHPGNVITLIAVSLVGLIGLVAASRALDDALYTFGLVLFAMAVLLDFQLIKRHFDRAELPAAT